MPYCMLIALETLTVLALIHSLLGLSRGCLSVKVPRYATCLRSPRYIDYAYKYLPTSAYDCIVSCSIKATFSLCACVLTENLTATPSRKNCTYPPSGFTCLARSTISRCEILLSRKYTVGRRFHLAPACNIKFSRYRKKHLTSRP